MSKVTMISSGEYSDYRIIAVVDWISEKTIAEAKAAYVAAGHGGRADYHGFCGWLKANGYCEDMECEEHYLGDYGQWEI